MWFLAGWRIFLGMSSRLGLLSGWQPERHRIKRTHLGQFESTETGSHHFRSCVFTREWNGTDVAGGSSLDMVEVGDQVGDPLKTSRVAGERTIHYRLIVNTTKFGAQQPTHTPVPDKSS